jgi:hypothetical protein
VPPLTPVDKLMGTIDKSATHGFSQRKCSSKALFVGFLICLAVVQTVLAAVTDEWVQRYNGLDGWSEHGVAVVFDAEGNVITTGSASQIDGLLIVPTPYDIYTVKYAAADGTILWATRYNGLTNNSDDRPVEIAADSHGNVVVVGSSGPRNNLDFYTAKYAAASGALLWERRYNGAANGNDVPSGLAIDGTGDVLVTGLSRGNGGDESYTAKYSGTNGALIWERRVLSQGRNIKLGTDGHFVLAGIADGHYYAAKHSSADGLLLWEGRTKPADSRLAVFRSCAVDALGNAIVTGFFSTSNTVTGYDHYTAKFSATNGSLVWENVYRSPGAGGDEPASMAIDADGDVFVTGTTRSDTNIVMLTVKHSGVTGALLWERQHESFQGAFGYSIRVNSLNDVVVSGSGANGDNTDFYTVGYSGHDGAVRWERPYNGLANRADQPFTTRGLALGPNGKVAVTGYSGGTNDPMQGFGNFFDMITIVYRERYAPVITCPSNIVLNCMSNGQAVATFSVSGVDDDGVAVAVMCVPPSGTAFPLGDTVVNCRAADRNGLTNYCSFTVTVQDLLPPTLRCPPDYRIEFSSASGAPANYAVESSDACDEAPLLTCVPASGETFPIGVTTVHCLTVDGSANSNSCTFTITVLGARGVKQAALDALIELRPSVHRPADARRLERAIKHLEKSLHAAYWIDETKLVRRFGGRVFIREKLAARSLCSLRRHQTDGAVQSVVAVSINRLFRADRLLAVVQIEQAVKNGVTSSRIERATRLLERADQVARHDRCAPAIELYRRAWRMVR